MGQLQLPIQNDTPQVRKINLARKEEENPVKKQLREKRKEMGKGRESDEDESDLELEPGCTLIHKLFARQVILQPDGKRVIKSGGRIHTSEAEALRVGYEAGLRVPKPHGAVVQNGVTFITMDFVEGQTLEVLWPTMSDDEKSSIANQLGVILADMRSMKPPPNHIGSCAPDGHIRDTRSFQKYYGPKCSDEIAFNKYLIGECPKVVPNTFKKAMLEHLGTNHRVVFTHGDLAPRNIMVSDGQVTGIIDWEDGGWYPEYWEYVKFFQRASGFDGDWPDYSEQIFPQCYSMELILYTALSRMQYP